MAESGSGRHGRKRGKNALQKGTNSGKDADPTVASDSGGNQTPMRVKSVDGRASRHPPARSDFLTSALLHAQDSAEKVSDQDGSTFAGAWAQSIPFSKSPPTDLLEGMTMGGSPPTGGTGTERGGFSKTPPSSPPTRQSRPVSSSAGMPPIQSRTAQSFSERPLRVAQQPFGASSPPPPHLPQAHFYGAPEIDLGIGIRLGDGRSEMQARFLSFAELPSVNPTTQGNRLDVVLLALEDRLDIIALEKDKLTAIGALEGVGGTILDARVLTWDFGNDPFHEVRPLVSLIVHGPWRRDLAPAATSLPASDHDTGGTSAPVAASIPGRASESTYFQTAVEVYSLSTQERVATLLWTQPSPGLPNMRGLPISVPPPVGKLKLDAGGNFLTVSSGNSGEIFVFGADSDTPKFRCMGKFWTAVQTLQDRRYSNSSNSTDTDTSPADVNRAGKAAPLPIMSLSSRWLAIVPPEPLACQSLPVSVDPGSTAMFVPGLESRNAPPLAPVSCVLESPDTESLMNRVARGVAQEVVRGARWLGDQGLQTWNHYWNRDQSMGAQAPVHNRNIYQADPQSPAGIFPPTHAPDSRPVSEAQLVSIIDLRVLSKGSYASNLDMVTPFATFQPPNGVSFLSFSPDGLALLSASRKGDVQYVWDLKQSRQLRAGILLANLDSETWARSAKVTQLARFARLTPSSIVDVQWTGPWGDRFALVTKNGTIHVFDLPLSAFTWPPLRRSAHLVPSSAPASPAVSAQPDEPRAGGGVFSSAIKLAGKTPPILANLRVRAPSVGVANAIGNGNNTIGFASATGIRGSKAVAAGLSRSVGAATGTVSSLRHAGDHRLHVNNLSRFPARSRVCWSQQRTPSALAVIDGQCIRSFRVSRRRASSKSGRQLRSIIETNPRLSLTLPGAEQLPVLQHDGGVPEGPAAGFWALRPSWRPARPCRIVHPLSCAEIDTNAPYQPFHSDGRVSLFVYQDRSAGGSVTHLHEPLIFGGDIATTRLDIHRAVVNDDDDQTNGASVLYRDVSMTSGEAIGSGEGRTEQVVVTTRRRKHKPSHQPMLVRTKSDDDDGFFEDDCDVLDFAENRV